MTMIKKIVYPFILIIMITSGCNNSNREKTDKSNTNSFSKGSFGYDLQFLKKHDDSLAVLSNDSGKTQVIVSPKYQAKVFTSTAEGNGGQSFGWVNYKAFSG